MKTSGRCSEPLKGSAHATVPACSLSRSAVSVSLWTSGRFEAFAHNDETVCLIGPFSQLAVLCRAGRYGVTVLRQRQNLMEQIRPVC